jgi:hypothetical protein
MRGRPNGARGEVQEWRVFASGSSSTEILRAAPFILDASMRFPRIFLLLGGEDLGGTASRIVATYDSPLNGTSASNGFSIIFPHAARRYRQLFSTAGISAEPTSRLNFHLTSGDLYNAPLRQKGLQCRVHGNYCKKLRIHSALCQPRFMLLLRRLGHRNYCKLSIYQQRPTMPIMYLNILQESVTSSDLDSLA